MSNMRDVLPAIKDLEPSEDRILWRYTDIPSLVEMLTIERLPLVNISSLSDQSEAALLKAALNKYPMATDVAKEYLLDMYKRHAFVSCWCESKEELAPMWERFSPRDGIAIKTNAKRLLNVLSSERLDIKHVEYIDDRNPDGLFLDIKMDSEKFKELLQDFFFYKMSDFSDEREVRILKRRAFLFDNFDRFIRSESSYVDKFKRVLKDLAAPKNGVYPVEEIDMCDLITEIVISPTARLGIADVIEKLLEVINYDRTVEDKPVFEFKVEESRRKMWY